MAEPAPKKTNWRLALAGLWLALTFSLSAWWMIHGMRQATDLAARFDGDEAAARQHRMFFWEGMVLLSFVTVGGGALAYFTYHDQRRNEEVVRFFSVFTHELKTSLTSLRLQAEILEEDPRNHGNENLQRLLRDVVRLELQLENALILAQDERSRLFPEEISLRRLLQNLSVHWPQLEVKVAEDALLRGDQRALECIFRNLLQNASVHGGARSVAVSASLATSGVGLDILLRDDGKGFRGEPATLGRAFVRHGTRSGSGIGLYLSRRLAARMGGGLEFSHGEGGKGFAARLRIPGSRA